MPRMAARKNPRSRVESKSQYKASIRRRGGGFQPPRFFQFELWFNTIVPEMGRGAQEHPNIPLQFLQGEAFAFLWVFFPGAVGLRVKIGFMPLARSQHEAAVDDLPAGRIENHDPLVATTGSERSLFLAGRLPSIVQREHQSGILAAVTQDGVAPGSVRWRGRPRVGAYKYARRKNRPGVPPTHVWHLETLSRRRRQSRRSKPDNSLNPLS